MKFRMKYEWEYSDDWTSLQYCIAIVANKIFLT